MSAKKDDLSRIAEIYSVITETQRQMKILSFDRARFMNPECDRDDLIAEGILNRVLRVTEEAGRMSDDVAVRYGFDRRGVSGVRNRLAHAYGDVDRAIIWDVITEDFPQLLRACASYCEDNGVDLC